MNKTKKAGGVILLITLILLNIIFAFLAVVGLIDEAENIAIVFAVLFAITLISTLVIFVGGYNKLVSTKNKIDESLSLVDVHLKLRFDLVPNLVEVVKGYIKHEKEVLEKVVELRNQAISESNENKKIEKANQLINEINNIIAVAENYPELKSNKLFLKLMEDLKDIENKVAASRRFYNANINEFNNIVEKFPSNLVAGMFGYSKAKLFQIEVNERILPKNAIKFD